MPGASTVVLRAALAAALAAVVAVVVVLAVQLGGAPAGLGIGDPGLLVRVGTPLLRLVVDAAAAVCVGALVFAVFLDPAPGLATVSPAGYAAQCWGGVAAAVWSAASVGLAVFSTAEGTGQPVATVLSSPGVWSVMGALEEPAGQLVAAGLALVAALGCRIALSWRAAVAVLGVAALGLLPAAVTGHAASATGHDLSMGSSVVHVVAAAVWVGSLVAVAVTLTRPGRVGESVLRRYGVLAGACWVVLVLSGLVEAVVLAPPSSWASTAYGALVVAKVGAAVLLGLGAAVLRRRYRGAGAAPGPGFVAAELLILVGALGVSVGMAFVVPPGLGRPDQTSSEALIGYNLAGPPTLTRLLLDWRPDVIFAAVVVVLAGCYAAGVRRMRRRGERWPRGRSAAWLLGCVTLLLATCSGVERYADAMFSVHMIQHMALAALVPVLLVLGGPLTLARGALRPVAPGAAPGPREWLAEARHARSLRVATHPLVVL
ncbi:MAG: cytochrome c oxidase assembly protein, partial [Pseudonocardiaceae bacterium]